jgi:hypothetical protein
MSTGSRAEVLHKKATHTSGELTASKLKRNPKSGEIVSKAKSTQGKKNDWAKSTKKARDEMIKNGDIEKGEMVLFNVGPKGKKLYKLAKEYSSA